MRMVCPVEQGGMWLGFGAMSRVGRLERRRSMEAVVEAPRVIAADDWLMYHAGEHKERANHRPDHSLCRGSTPGSFPVFL